MKKIKLNLDELTVSSFATAKSKAKSGTVNAYSGNPCYLTHNDCFTEECHSFPTEVSPECYTTQLTPVE